MLAIGAVAGCGSDDDDSPVGSAEPPGRRVGEACSASLSATCPQAIDPLAASSRPAQIIARQAYEPLVARTRGPYGYEPCAGGPGERGHAIARPQRSWSVLLRPGVSFQDGTPLDAAAVLANARRWVTTRQGQRLLPSLFAADTPRPGVVRLLFEGAAPGRRAPARLAAARHRLAPRPGAG